MFSPKEVIQTMTQRCMYDPKGLAYVDQFFGGNTLCSVLFWDIFKDNPPRMKIKHDHEKLTLNGFSQK